MIFAPFLFPPKLLFQALHRIFPFGRGLFEDKVANVWCALNVVVKIRDLASTPTLARLSAALTLFATMPIIVGMVWVAYQLRKQIRTPSVLGIVEDSRKEEMKHRRGPSPIIKLLPHALFASAMAFFLLSFQVHEKTILLPLMPLTLLMAGKQPGQVGQDYEWALLLNNVGSFR